MYNPIINPEEVYFLVTRVMYVHHVRQGEFGYSKCAMTKIQIRAVCILLQKSRMANIVCYDVLSIHVLKAHCIIEWVSVHVPKMLLYDLVIPNAFQ